MLLSRSASILKTASQLNAKKNVALNLKQTRNKWCYRCNPEPSIAWNITSEVVAGFAWWWVLYSFWHHGDHFFGEYPYPNPEDWTDEELGIPSEMEFE